MIKTSATKIAFLLAVLLLVLTGSAYAIDYSQFKLRIEDTANGYGVVITGSDAALNMSVDPVTHLPAPYQIVWQGCIGSVAECNTGSNFFTNVSLAYSETDANGAVLSLSASVTNQGANAGEIRFTVEDSNYPQTTPPTAVLTGTLGGVNAAIDPTAPARLDPNSTATFQNWINTANNAPNFGCDGVYNGANVNCGSAALNPAAVTIPGDSLADLPIDAGSNGKTFTDGSFNGYQQQGNVNLTGPAYSLHSQATFDLAGKATAEFTFQSQVTAGSCPTCKALTSVSAPEPTSLLLLGSSLLGLGVCRRKHGRKA